MWEITTTLLPHQDSGVDKLKGLKVGLIKGDMGTGKTLAMLNVAHYKAPKGYSRVLWVCPNATIPGLIAQIREHTTANVCQVTEAGAAEADIVVIGYEAIQASDRQYEAFRGLVHDAFLVLDESHFIKNARAKRTKRIASVSLWAKYRFALTGTPIGLDLYDYFSQLHALSPLIWNCTCWGDFRRRYTVDVDIPSSLGTRTVMKTVKQRELVNMMRPYLVEFDKNHLLKLPGKAYRKVYSSPSFDFEEDYQLAKREILDEYGRYGITEAVIYRLIATLHGMLGRDPARMDALKTALKMADQHEKVIIWVKYRYEAEQLTDTLGDAALLMDGRHSTHTRHGIVETFKTSSKRYLVTNQQVGGTGLNLQFCSGQVFFNQSWCFILRQQAEDRIHRIGQQAPTVAYYDIESSLGIDRMLHRCLDRKERLKDFVNELIRGDIKMSNEELVKKVGEIL